MGLVPLRGPEWIFGLDAVFEGVAALVVLGVVILSYKVYRLTQDKKYAGLSAAFGALCLAFIARAITYSVVHSEPFAAMLGITTKDAVSQFFLGGYGAFIALSLLAYTGLVVLLMRIRDKRLIILLLGVLFAGMVYSGSYYRTYYLFSTLLLGLCAVKLYQNYIQRRQTVRLTTWGAFTMLTLAQLAFLFQPALENLNPVAHIAQLAGVVILAGGLLTVLFRK